LLFVHVGALGVSWLRIATAAAVFALWRRPWRLLRRMTPSQRWVLAGLGAVLAVMNAVFYLALTWLPLSTVGAIEFLGTVALAALGARTPRNFAALGMAVGGVAALTELRLADAPWGFVFAFANCAGFVLYVVVGHRIANAGVNGSGRTSAVNMSGVDQLGAAMLVAAVAITPLSVTAAIPAFSHPLWLLWGVGVGVCSSVIPYVADQLAMARLSRTTFALMLALLPAAATVMGVILLAQMPTWQDLLGIGLVIAGVALHHDPRPRTEHAEGGG
jgi:inner membrane transporter RhtA